MGLLGSAGDLVLPDIDINWLEPTRLNIQVMQQADLLPAWSGSQVCTMYCCKTITFAVCQILETPCKTTSQLSHDYCCQKAPANRIIPAL